MCPKDGLSLDLDPDPINLMDLDLDLDPDPINLMDLDLNLNLIYPSLILALQLY